MQLTVERKPEKRSGGATRFHHLNGASATGECTTASRIVSETAGEPVRASLVEAPLGCERLFLMKEGRPRRDARAGSMLVLFIKTMSTAY